MTTSTKTVNTADLSAAIAQASMTTEAMKALLCVDLLTKAAKAKLSEEGSAAKASDALEAWRLAAQKAGLTGEMLKGLTPMRAILDGVISELFFSAGDRKLLDLPTKGLSDTKKVAKESLMNKRKARVQYFILKLDGKSKTKTVGGTSKASEPRKPIEIAVEKIAGAIRSIQNDEAPTQADIDTLAAFTKAYDTACKSNRDFKVKYSITGSAKAAI